MPLALKVAIAICVIYDVYLADKDNTFRAVAKVNHSPIRVGDRCALLREGKVSDDIITITQIGFGERTWEGKEPGKITTIFVETALTAQELQGNTFIQIR